MKTTNKYFPIIAISLFTISSFGQHTINGIVVDHEVKEALLLF